MDDLPNYIHSECVAILLSPPSPPFCTYRGAAPFPITFKFISDQSDSGCRRALISESYFSRVLRSMSSSHFSSSDNSPDNFVVSSDGSKGRIIES